MRCLKFWATMTKKRVFGGISPKYSDKNTAAVLLQSIPFDGTSTWGKGADQGFDVFIEASENMELYDIETDAEVYKKGIHVLPQSPEFHSAEKMFEYVYQHTRELLKE